MAQTQHNAPQNDSTDGFVVSKEAWITAGRAAGFVMRDSDGAMRLFKNDMLAWLPMPNGNGGLVTVARAMAEFGANRGGQSLNGVSFQQNVSNVAKGDGPSAKVANNNAEERAFKAFLTPLAAAKLNIDLDADKVSAEDSKRLNDYLNQACDHAPLREKYFARALKEAEEAGSEVHAASEKKKRGKKASTADFTL